MLLSNNQLGAQEYLPFPQDSAVWYIVRSYPWPHPPFIYYDTWQFETKGDTIINDKTYTQLFYGINGSQTWYNGAYRVVNDSNLVYFYDSFYNIGEKLAYDYNLLPGDTIIVNGADYICTDTGAFLLNNGNYHKYQLMHVPHANNCIQTWVQGIGSLRFPLKETLYHCGYTFESANDLTCFFYKGEKIYQWAENPYFQGCFGFNTGIGIEEIMPVIFFTIAPNPVTGTSFLVTNLTDETLMDYKIYDINGRILIMENGIKPNDIIIINNMFAKGVYLLELFLHNKDKYYSIKFVIN